MRIAIKGTIVPSEDKWMYDALGLDAFCAADLHRAVADAAPGELLEVDINSGGGDLMEGSEIYAALQRYAGPLRIHIVGMACSAASVIACAGPCDMVRTGLLMIHNVSAWAAGDHRDMAREAGILQTADRAVAAAYRAKTGKTTEELLEAMGAETWLTAEEALQAGFVDAIAEPATRLAADSGGLLPEKTIRDLRARRAQANLNLLRLKGATK